MQKGVAVIMQDEVEVDGKAIAAYKVLGQGADEDIIEGYRRMAREEAEKACEALCILPKHIKIIEKDIPMRLTEDGEYVCVGFEDEPDFVAHSVGWKLNIQ